MHKFIQTICLFVLLTFALNTQAQIINIPDANFKAKLLEASTINLIAFDSSNNPIKIDTNNDGDIQIVEANKVHQLAVDNSNTIFQKYNTFKMFLQQDYHLKR